MKTEKVSNVNAYEADTPPTRLEGETLPGLIRGLAHDLTTLFSKELALAKAEVREAASDVKASVAGMALGATLALGGVVMLLTSATYGLSMVVAPWLAALIVGLASLLIGYGMVKGAQAKVKDGVTPERTLNSVQKDKATVERAVR